MDGDASLALLRQRMELLRAAMNGSGGDDGDVASDVLLKACLKDPFLRELQGTMLSDPRGVQTIGKIRDVRNKVLELQPSASKVIELMDYQRNGLAVLLRIIQCVEKEGETWRSGVQALAKAYAEEEKAKRKADEKEKKDEERKRVRLAKAAARDERQKREREARAAEQAAAAQAEAEGGAESGAEEEEKTKTRTRRRTGGAASELDPSDPAVLRTLRVAHGLPSTSITEEMSGFVNKICMQPDLPTVLRFKKGMAKKVLSVSWLL